jgi:hypothetical protein
MNSHPRTRVVGLLAFLVGAPAVIAQTPRYTVTLVPPLPGNETVNITAINNHGAVVGTSSGPSTSVQLPFYFHPSTGTVPIPVPVGYAYSFVTDINDQGVIIGFCANALDDTHPRGWRYENGVLTLQHPNSHPHAINNAGITIGRTCWTDAFSPYFACYFLDNHTTPALDITFGAAQTSPMSLSRFADLNDLGQAVYTAPPLSPAQFRSADGSLVTITPPTAPYVRTFTWGLNNNAQAIGRWEYNVGSQYFSRAFIWTAATGATQVGTPGTHVRPKGLNNLGHVVGETGNNQNSSITKWLWTPQGGNEEVAPLIEPTLQLAVSTLAGINDRGQIVGTGVRGLPPVIGVAFILNPINPPCPADLDNGSGTGTPDNAVDISDLLYFLVQFEVGSIEVDLDNDGDPAVGTPDGGVDINDLLFFLARFETGC